MKTYQALQVLMDYLAMKDDTLPNKIDVLAFFGGSLASGIEPLAKEIKTNRYKTIILVGGYGHTTQSLFDSVNMKPDPKTEAELFERLLKQKYKLTVDYLECRSTNCGNNISFLKQLLEEKNIEHKSILLMQESTMQRRLYHTARHQFEKEIKFYNHACYKCVFDEEGYKEAPEDMWPMEKTISMLLGEIKRLQDYGPQGTNYIEHVDIPKEVLEAYNEIICQYPNLCRQANPAFKKGL